MCLFRRRQKTLEERVPHQNWLIIIGLFLALAYAVFIMFTPSIYQFVTTSRNLEVKLYTPQ
jgi:hypothetical protein